MFRLVYRKIYMKQQDNVCSIPPNIKSEDSTTTCKFSGVSFAFFYQPIEMSPEDIMINSRFARMFPKGSKPRIPSSQGCLQLGFNIKLCCDRKKGQRGRNLGMETGKQTKHSCILYSQQIVVEDFLSGFYTELCVFIFLPLRNLCFWSAKVLPTKQGQSYLKL